MERANPLKGFTLIEKRYHRSFASLIFMQADIKSFDILITNLNLELLGFQIFNSREKSISKGKYF